jgi:hypothetical protein
MIITFFIILCVKFLDDDAEETFASILFKSSFHDVKTLIEEQKCMDFESKVQIVSHDEDDEEIRWTLSFKNSNNQFFSTCIKICPKQCKFLTLCFKQFMSSLCFAKSHVIVIVDFLHENRFNLNSKDVLSMFFSIPGLKKPNEICFRRKIQNEFNP